MTMQQSNSISAVVAHADSIYFLMFPGWSQELRSNRWHYASRWAQHLPVVLVQPDLPTDDTPPHFSPEPRIPNCRILHVRSTDVPCTMVSRLVQARQILADMIAHGHRRPILWAYVPDYVFSYGMVPAVLRFFHATENYFYFERLGDDFVERLKCMLGMSDIVAGVSEGVAASQRPFTSGRTEVVTNGCDYKDYSRGGRDTELEAARCDWSKIAVYAGNINNRIDFDLFLQCARACPEALFALFGPVAGLSPTDKVKWNAVLQQPNVRYFGAVGIERLPPIFGTADVGLIPYRNVPILVENTFPLKAFEMQATGLPVVSTYMRAIEPHAGPGLRIATSVEQFIDNVKITARDALGEADRQAIAIASAAQDYDCKFERVCSIIAETLKPDQAPRAPGAALFGFHGSADNWLRSLDQAISEIVIPKARVWAAWRTDLASRLSPSRDRLAAVLPERVRTALGRSSWYRALFR